MPIIQQPTMMSLNDVRNIVAGATNLQGLTIRQDFLPVVGDYKRKETTLWQLIQKNPANAPKIQEIRRTIYPQVGWVNRGDLTGAPANLPGDLAEDLTDPGQDVKAVAGIIECPHFARSMLDQQGAVYGNQIAKDTTDLIVSTMRFLERGLYRGDATADPLAFNGLTRQLANPSHIFSADITGSPPDKIHDRLDDICLRASMDVNVIRRVSHIFCSGAGLRILIRELKELQLYENVVEISPGVQVPSILTAYGYVPIIPTPYILDEEGDPNVAGSTDTIRFWLVDMDTVEWYGVFPYGGQSVYDPQIFDITNTVNGVPLLERRIILCYGTLYAKNRGEGIFRLDVKAPLGSSYGNG